MTDRWPPAQPTVPPRPRDAQRCTPQPGTVSARIDAVGAAALTHQNARAPDPIATTLAPGTVAGRVLAINLQGAPAEAWGRAVRAALDAVEGEGRITDRARLEDQDALGGDQRSPEVRWTRCTKP